MDAEATELPPSPTADCGHCGDPLRGAQEWGECSACGKRMHRNCVRPHMEAVHPKRTPPPQYAPKAKGEVYNFTEGHDAV